MKTQKQKVKEYLQNFRSKKKKEVKTVSVKLKWVFEGNVARQIEDMSEQLSII